MQLQHVVVTSVDRDDLSDGGAEIFSAEINAIRQQVPTYQMEVLIPDFQANWEVLATVVKQAPEILDRNVDTVRRLTPVVRAKAQYDRSPTVLKKRKVYAINNVPNLASWSTSERHEMKYAQHSMIYVRLRWIS